LLAGIDARTQRRRHHLRAEANAEDRLAALQPRAHQCDFFGNEGIFRAVVHADRTAEHHQQIGCGDRSRGQRVDTGLDIVDVEAGLLQYRSKVAEIFKGEMADNETLHDELSKEEGYDTRVII